MIKYLSILLFCCCFTFLAQGQNNFTQQLVPTDKPEIFFQENKFRFRTDFPNDFEADQAIQKFMLSLYARGYVSASVDSTLDFPGGRNVFINVGDFFEWEELRAGNVEGEILSQTGYREKNYSGKLFDFRQLNRLLEKVLSYNENNGYPFAQVRLDSVDIDGSKVSAVLNVQKGPLFTFDTLGVPGDVRISRAYLYNYLGIKPGNLYNESVVRKASKRIRELSFLQEARSLDILFSGDKARVNLYLLNRRASRFDLLIGILPNNEITGRVLLTGEANLNLVSPFGAGETIYLNWKQLKPLTQSLDAGFQYPYILATPFGADLDFSLYKLDTTFLDVVAEAGIRYLFIGGNYLKGFVNNKFTNILTVDTNQIILNRTLPANSDVRNTLYGLEYYFQKLDYRFNPRKGYELKLKGGVGRRRILKNQTIVSLNDPENPGGTFEGLYDSLQLNSVHYSLKYALAKYWPIGRRSTFLTGIKGGTFISDNIFENELFRIGGTNLLRGFDEQSLFVSQYDVLTLEYRFLLSANSYFSMFWDGAYVENRSGNGIRRDLPYGFGAGLAFETKAGLFAVSYALGSQQGNPIDFKSAKIHFGYVNYF